MLTRRNDHELAVSGLHRLTRRRLVPGPTQGISRGYRQGIPRLWPAIALRRLLQVSRLEMDRPYRDLELQAALWISGAGVGITSETRKALAYSASAAIGRFARQIHSDTWSQQRLITKPPRFLQELTRSLVDAQSPTSLLGSLAQHGISDQARDHVAHAFQDPRVAALIRWFFTCYFSASEDVRTELQTAVKHLSGPARQFLGGMDQFASLFAGILSGDDAEVETIISRATDDQLLTARRWTWIFGQIGLHSNSHLRDILMSSGVSESDALQWVEVMQGASRLLRPRTPTQWLIEFALITTVVPAARQGTAGYLDFRQSDPRPAA